jgi:DNA-binding NarL/FixJ family response regulator
MIQLLLVEDDPTAREALARALARAGYQCHQAASVEQAEAALAARPIAVAVVDIVLGPDDLGGLRLLPLLRAAPGRPPVVMITAFADVERVKAALNSGASFLLEKPFRAPELIDVLSRLLAERPAAEHDAVARVIADAGLTDKEAQVARLVLKGLRSQEIARLEGNSEKTIRHHITQIYVKCGVSSRAELFHLVFPS